MSVSVSMILELLALGCPRIDILREWPELMNRDITAACFYASEVLEKSDPDLL